MNINIEEYSIYIKPGVTDLRKRAERVSHEITTSKFDERNRKIMI